MWSEFEKLSKKLDDTGYNDTTDRISTIDGSLASVLSEQTESPVNDRVYDTDHTDLNSDYDESELRRELLQDRWRQLFDKFDPEGFGEIPVDEFLVALKSSDLQSRMPFNKIELLYHRATSTRVTNPSGVISFQEFVNVITHVSDKTRNE